MGYNRLPLRDPRTVAREIPGIFDVIFPQLTPGAVCYFNKAAKGYDVRDVPESAVSQSALEKAMLFEIAVARAEQILEGKQTPDWDACLNLATLRQKRHFDAKTPDNLSENDLRIAELVGSNLVAILNQIQKDSPTETLKQAPLIPGYQWIAPGNGDFSIGQSLIEVKCKGSNFGSADYRQILMYWLLSYSASIESDVPEWSTGILINPRRNKVVMVSFNELIKVTSAGRSKIEILELFSSLVGDYALRSLPEFRL